MLQGNSSILRYDLSLRRNDWDQVANEQNYIGMRVMPAAPVAKQSSKFTRLSIASTMTPIIDTTRMPRGAYKRDEFGWTTDSYSTTEHGFEGPVDDAEIEMYGDFLPVEQITAQRVASVLLAEHEQAVANAVFNSGSYAGNQTIACGSGNRFQDAATATPIETIMQAKWNLRAYGVKANAMIIPQIALDYLMLSQEVIGRIKYSGKDDPKQVTLDMLKAILSLDHILVGDGYLNSATPGVTATIARFWNPTMTWVGRIADADSDLTSPSICVGRTVMFVEQNAQIPGIGETNAEPAIIMEEYREEQRRGGVIRGRWNWQIKPFDDPMNDGTFFRAGVLITNVTDGSTL